LPEGVIQQDSKRFNSKKYNRRTRLKKKKTTISWIRKTGIEKVN
jgi:hypothetical protein